MVVPFGSARGRRSRTTYRPTVTPEGSTLVAIAFTGITSCISRTDLGTVAVGGRGSPTGFREGPSDGR